MMTFVWAALTALVNYFVKNAATKAQYLKNIASAQHRYEGTVDSAANLRSAEKLLDEELAKAWEAKWGPKPTPTSLLDAKRLKGKQLISKELSFESLDSRRCLSPKMVTKLREHSSNHLELQPMDSLESLEDLKPTSLHRESQEKKEEALKFDEGKITALEYADYVFKNAPKLPVPPKPTEEAFASAKLVLKDIDALKATAKPLDLKIKK